MACDPTTEPKAQHHHFLLVTISAQGQINPARHLARHLAQATTSHVTVATPISSHRLLFPSHGHDVDVVVDDGPLLSYAPYSDGFDQGFHPERGDVNRFLAQLPLIGSQTLTRLARSLSDRGRPVTCIIYTLLTDWAADVAAQLSIPSVLYWIQPASVFSIFYHYFNGIVNGHAADIINPYCNNPSSTLKLPGLPLLHAKDLPSVLTLKDPLLKAYENIMTKALPAQAAADQGRPIFRVLVNTFYELEADAIDSIRVDVDLVPVGPMIESTASELSTTTKDLFERETGDYMAWLDTKEAKTVVYISFGSMSKFSTAEMEEMLGGLKASGKPYLWVVRRDVREADGEFVERLGEEAARSGGQGMVIEWCEQVRVLKHEAVGCFVTHCGWNSVLESLVCGVPTVMMPQRMEQTTNAKMAVDVWGSGVRAEGAGEVGRCLEVVMGEGERGEGIRTRVEVWRVKAKEAVEGAAVKNMCEFVKNIT